MIALVLRASSAIKNIAFVLTAVTAATAIAATAATTGTETTAGPASDTTALVAEGRALYRGSIAFQNPPTLHGVALASNSQGCAACHGVRGAARTEAGVAVPAIQWQRLANATVSRPAYADTGQVLQALAGSRTGSGRPLEAPMPRFALSPREQQALAAYLPVLGTEADPVAGVDGQRIVLGSVLPLSGPQAAAGNAIRTALQRRIDGVNATGGIFGRRLELVVAEAGPDAASADAAAEALVRGGHVFALVASLLPETGEGLRQTLAAHDTAMVATLGLPVSPAPDPRVSWLLPSLAQQARELAAELQRACPAPAGASEPLRVLYLRGSALTSASLPDARWQAVTDAASLRAALRPPRPARTLALLPAPLADLARSELAAPGTSDTPEDGRAAPCLGTLAALSGESAAGRRGLRELVALPMPPVPLDDGAGSPAVLWPLLADSALAVMTEALARAGRQLDTAGLIAALDTVHRFEPRPGLALDFSRRRRHGFDVSYLWKEPSDETREIRPSRR